VTLSKEEQLEHLQLAAEVAGLKIDDFTLPGDHFITLNGLRFHYLDWGKLQNNATRILFLHGGGLTAHTWDVVCLALRSQYHCIALDLRGHGDSEGHFSPDGTSEQAGPLPPGGPEVLASDTEELVKKLKLEPFILVGHSMGGLTSIAYAGQHSKGLQALVLVDVGPNVRFEGSRRVREFMSFTGPFNSIEEVIELSMKYNPRRDPRLLRRSLMHNLKQLPDGKWTWKRARGQQYGLHEQHGQMPPQAHRDGQRPADQQFNNMLNRHQELWKYVAGITCPALVVRGGESDVFFDEDAEELARRLPQGRWVRVEKAAHTVQGDNSRGLTEALNGFFTDLGL
jgi:pimeloyl-ACP methyl ester carboxylesterase